LEGQAAVWSSIDALQAFFWIEAMVFSPDALCL
jgi:hypothetical protein